MEDSLPWLAFFIGVSISIDVMFGTIANFIDTSVSFQNWTLPLALFHILLFLAGSYLLWTAVELKLVNERTVSAIGGILISWLVLDLLWQSLTTKLLPYGPNWLAIKAGLEENSGNRVLAMLAVSFDALFVGLANPAEDASMIIVAVMAGVVVGICTQTALWLAKILRGVTLEGPRLILFGMFGSFCSTTAINTFGIMAFQRAWGQEAGLLDSAMWSVLIMGAVYTVLFRRLWQNEVTKN